MPVIRAANNGISGAIDARGRVLDAFALNVRGALDVTVDVPAPQPPRFGNPDRNGMIVAGLFALMGLGLSLRQRIRRI